MRTVRTKVYQFNELDNAAKQRAIDCWLNGETFDYIFDEAFESVKIFAEHFNIKVRQFDFLEPYRSEYSFNNDECILDLSGNRLRTYLINNYYSILFEPKKYGKYKKRTNGKYRYDRYSKCQFIETTCPFTGVCYDEDLIEPLRKFINSPSSTDFKSLLQDCISLVCKSVESGIEGSSTYEAVSDTITANEYEFTKDGNIF